MEVCPAGDGRKGKAGPHSDMEPQTLPIPGAASRAGERPAYLMCPPKHYEVNYVINPWMTGNVHRSSRQRAAEQWEELHKVMREVARVLLVEPQPGSPDMVFTANAGLVRDGMVALSSFHHKERQGEEPHFRRWFADRGFAVEELPRLIAFEGEGDALFEADGRRLWAGHGMRTREDSHRLLVEMFNVEVEPLGLVDPRFYHLDTCFCPLSNGDVMYFPGAFDPASLGKIEVKFKPSQRICVSEPDALRFACNAINVGRMIIVNEISEELSAELESREFEVVQLKLDEFLKAGGAAKCLVLRLG